jgi:hypothetical protein
VAARRRSPRVYLLLLLLCPVFLAACETDDYGPVKIMQAMPESYLPPYPDATLLGQGSIPRRSSPEEGTYPAQLQRQFGTTAPESAVIAYYESLLKPLGWAQGCPVCSNWSKPGYTFSLLDETIDALPSRDQGYTIVYDERLTEDIDHTPPPATGQ